MEGDILWHERFNTPENDYRDFRESWLRICKNISQGGIPVLWCGCVTPQQNDPCIESRYFSEIRYLAVVADGEQIRTRLQARPSFRGSADDGFITSNIEFNQWFKDRSQDPSHRIELLDNTDLTVEQAADFVLSWIKR